MTNELLRLTSARMADLTHGFNAMLVIVPRDVGDPAPAAVTTIADESTDNVVARGLLPKATPALVITMDRDPSAILDDTVVQEVGHVEAKVLAQISVDENDAAQGIQDAGYYLRALAWVVRRWVTADVNSSARKRNNFAIIELGRAELLPMFKQIEDRVVVAGIRIPMTGRDLITF